MIEVEAEIEATLEHAWNCWASAEHIVHWNFAIPEWCCPYATNDLQDGGKFSWRMEAKDGSMGFDFSGTHTRVRIHESIQSRLDDGRSWEVRFESGKKGVVKITETFEPDAENDLEMQRAGWQAILNNFRAYAEG